MVGITERPTREDISYDYFPNGVPLFEYVFAYRIGGHLFEEKYKVTNRNDYLMYWRRCMPFDRVEDINQLNDYPHVEVNVYGGFKQPVRQDRRKMQNVQFVAMESGTSLSHTRAVNSYPTPLPRTNMYAVNISTTSDLHEHWAYARKMFKQFHGTNVFLLNGTEHIVVDLDALHTCPANWVNKDLRYNVDTLLHNSLTYYDAFLEPLVRNSDLIASQIEEKEQIVGLVNLVPMVDELPKNEQTVLAVKNLVLRNAEVPSQKPLVLGVGSKANPIVAKTIGEQERIRMLLKADMLKAEQELREELERFASRGLSPELYEKYIDALNLQPNTVTVEKLIAAAIEQEKLKPEDVIDNLEVIEDVVAYLEQEHEEAKFKADIVMQKVEDIHKKYDNKRENCVY